MEAERLRLDELMISVFEIDHSPLDRPEVLTRLFHPRSEYREREKLENAIDLLIPVEGNLVVGGRFHLTSKSAPNILFFHGNGEIVADYEDLGPLYAGRGMNFLPVDYRGYGRSTGTPTIAAMLADCRLILDFVREWLGQRGFSGPLMVMGRSLGSAPALELAAGRPEHLDGLIIESGFAYAGPLSTA